MRRLRIYLLALTAFAALVAHDPVAVADGGGGGGGGGGNGETAAASAEAPEWAEAKRAIAAKDYARAVPLLQAAVATNPRNADAYNYLGYASARAGETERALEYYKRALAIKPGHRGANEYLGELHLKLGDLAAAEARLKVLDDACFFGCTEYDLLKAAIRTYKETGKFQSRKGL
jgi:tetratricopeptide (TPR) repeat protein